jgi:hypothetical protein
MRTALLAILAAFVTFLTLAGPAGARTPQSFFGVMADGPLLAPDAPLRSEARLMRRSGVGTVRVAFYWRDMQPEAGMPVDFTASDRMVGALSSAGLEILPVLVRAPAWAAGGDIREGAVPDPAAYATFVRAFVERYGRRGSFWPSHAGRDVPIRSYQVWNEPDIDRYWEGEPWASTYVTLLRAARAAIKAADPHAKVVAAGLTNRSWEDLARLYRAGARGLFDAAAIHPFSRRVENVVKIVRLARKEMRRRGDARVPLLLTEVSWSSGKGRSSFNYGWETTERGQAAKVREALRALARERTRLRIGGVWWYTWLSPALGEKESFSYSGLRRMRGGRPVSKPALTAFRQTVRSLRRR